MASETVTGNLPGREHKESSQEKLLPGLRGEVRLSRAQRQDSINVCICLSRRSGERTGERHGKPHVISLLAAIFHTEEG